MSTSAKVWAAIGTAAAGVAGLAAGDLLQRKNSILRNYPVIGHARYALEGIRPMIQQYFIERDWDGRPFNKTTRDAINSRANGDKGEESFGTQRNVNELGYEFFVHSMVPKEEPKHEHRVMIGGNDCTKPYSMALMNISAMSFGALSANAVMAMNEGAKLGGFAHDTGEGGMTDYHRRGGDVVWELGTGYFGARTKDGGFDADKFADVAAEDEIKCTELKLSQGAKPGLGGVLPGPKVTAEIAKVHNVPQGQTVISPPFHQVFSTPIQLIEFVAKMRDLSGGKPAGFKLCVTSMEDVLAICKAIREVGTAPDFITVDGSEGGTGAAPVEFEDHMGMPLTQGLMLVHNALVGTGLRDQIRIGASGKVAEGNSIVKRLIQGADYTNAARSMMMATGCIQSMRCSTGTCPVGVATQDPRRMHALDVPTKSQRVYQYQKNTVAQAQKLMASMGVDSVADLHPGMLRRNTAPDESKSYAELYDWLQPGELLDDAPEGWANSWKNARADKFGPVLAYESANAVSR